jgi:hypothetical protein
MRREEVELPQVLAMQSIQLLQSGVRGSFQGQLLALFSLSQKLISAKEGQDSVVDLSAEDSEMVNWLLFTLYGRTFEVDWHGEANKDEEIDRWDTQLLYFGRLYALAHRLDVTAVAGLAVVEYRNWFEPVGDATTSLLPDLVKIAYEDLPEDDRALKDPLVKYIRQHMAQIKGNVDASKELQEIISTTAQLGWDLLR